MALILVIEAQNTSYTLTVDYSLSGAFCTITWYDGSGNEISEASVPLLGMMEVETRLGDCDHQTMGTRQYKLSSGNGSPKMTNGVVHCTIHIHGSLDKWKFTPESPCS
ncbi:hypothetical protein Glove_606g148 [Diversispora epigaea]|uniref:Uncharacterized protein n=1 Tax=Diversispora epigaea TaxID=1348612 RepID=A0A397GBG3_9GLOM|nr:hypothetical protein Glove_606g148 [Diversispora epigaea]